MGLEALTGLMGLIPNDLWIDRDQWIEIGHGLKALCESDDEGFDVFDAWSASWEGGYDAAATRKAWDSFGAGGLKSKGQALKARAEGFDAGGFKAWAQQQASSAFDDGAGAADAAAALAAGVGVNFGTDQQKAARAVLRWYDGRIKRLGEGDWRQYDETTGLWLAWGDNHMLRLIEALAHDRKQKAIDKAQAKKLGSRAFLSSVAVLAAINASVVGKVGDFDSSPLLLGVPSGVIDLGRGASRAVRKGAPAEMVSKRMGVDPAPLGTPCPVWTGFLAEFCQGDAALEEWLQVYAGYALTGLVEQHVMPFFYGSGGNGKSVFLNVLRSVWGEYGAQIDHRLLFEKSGGFHLAPLAVLAGVRLGTVTDVASGAVWDTQIMKMLTGGDEVTANRMHQDPITFRPVAKLLVSGNDMPMVKDMDDGIKRRMRMLPMTGKPKAVDVQLPEKLRGEYGAILRWALEGLDLYWMRGGLAVSKAVDDETEAYSKMLDPFGRWVKECVVADTAAGAKVRGPGSPGRARVSVSDLFRSWDAFRAGEGRHAMPPQSSGALSRKMATKGFVFATVEGRSYLYGYTLAAQENASGVF